MRTADAVQSVSAPIRFALLGNPNTGKTTLFNRLCGLRTRTANYPGTTAEARLGECTAPGATRYQIIDLPGVYSLNVPFPEAELCNRALAGALPGRGKPDRLLVVADATNLSRNFVLFAESLAHRFPTVVALTMADLAAKQGVEIKTAELERRLGCPVVAVNGRDGLGMEALFAAMARATPPGIDAPTRDIEAEAAWAQGLVESTVVERAPRQEHTLSDRFDRLATHPLWGTLFFLAVMSGLFATIFWLAELPMNWIEQIFSIAGGWISNVIPAGLLRELLVNGVIAGIAGTVVFLPQILLLFFLLSLLEDTGYIARAAFVADRYLRRFGLPGQAFVPLLSSHACAIPGILCSKLIPDPKDRIATILVAPFLSCSARLPVYVLLISLLFAGEPLYAGLAFTSCYLLGAAAALISAWIARRTVLRGKPRPMILELPAYRRPSLTTALLISLDRARTFLKKAGTVILAICIVMWWLGTFPHAEPSARVLELEGKAAAAAERGEAGAAELTSEAERVSQMENLSSSFLGKLGRGVEPVLAPLGFDWQISIAVMSSFLAREVFVSAVTVVIGSGTIEDEKSVVAAVASARRSDGRPLLDHRTAWSLLVFYVLAMQCLPTLAVTRRETGAWKWAGLQFAYMSVVAYACAFATYQILGALEIA